MDIEIESRFVKTYIKKNRRERICFELGSQKKRINAIGKFCHNALDYIDKNKIIYQGTSLEQGMGLMNIPYKGECYLISWDEFVDGRIFETEEAIEKMRSDGMATIAVFPDFCIIKTEQTVGPAEIYICYSSLPCQ